MNDGKGGDDGRGNLIFWPREHKEEKAGAKKKNQEDWRERVAMENGDEEEGEREGWREREFPDEYCKSERERERVFCFLARKSFKGGRGLGVEELKSVECGNGRRGGRNYMQDTYSCVCVCVCVSARRG